MLARPIDRVQSRRPRPAGRDPGPAQLAGRRIVAAFEHRLHAERAVGALLDIGLAADQIRVEGPARPPLEPRRPARAGAVAWAALLGAAALTAAPAGSPGWLRAALGLPA